MLSNLFKANFLQWIGGTLLATAQNYIAQYIFNDNKNKIIALE